jgi:CRISPR system Cascade subunit CasB
MTQTAEQAAPATRQRRLGALGKALSWQLERLQREYLAGRPAARAELARLRRGLGKQAGSVPEIWDLTIGAVPDSLMGTFDEPSRAEESAHAVLTLYASHQQSRPSGVHRPGTPFGRAVSLLRAHESTSEEAVTRRFLAAATAESTDEVLTHVRGLVNQMKKHDLGLDYAAFADDIVGLLAPGGAVPVRLRWARDFHRRSQSGTDSTHDTESSEPQEASS